MIDGKPLFHADDRMSTPRSWTRGLLHRLRPAPERSQFEGACCRPPHVWHQSFLSTPRVHFGPSLQQRRYDCRAVAVRRRPVQRGAAKFIARVDLGRGFQATGNVSDASLQKNAFVFQSEQDACAPAVAVEHIVERGVLNCSSGLNTSSGTTTSQASHFMMSRLSRLPRLQSAAPRPNAARARRPSTRSWCVAWRGSSRRVPTAGGAQGIRA